MAGSLKAADPGLCNDQDAILCLIDVQTRLLPALNEAQRGALLRNCATLLQAADQLAIPTIITEHYPKGLGPTTPELLRLRPGVSEVISKTAFSAHGVADFDRLIAMSGRSQLILCGMETHVCVLQTALQAKAAGLDVFLAADATCSRVEANRDNALARLSRAGVHISCTESVLFEWLGDAERSEFRGLLELIRPTG